MPKWLPFLLPALAALWILSALRAPQDAPDGFAFQEFGRLPIVANGRTQPLDSLARNSLLQLREKQTLNTAPWESGAPTMPAIAWLAEVFFHPAQADTRPVFRIDNPDVKSLLGVPFARSAEQKTDGKHYSWLHLRGKLEALQAEAQRVEGAGTSKGVTPAKQTPYEQAVVRLWRNVVTYMRLQNTLQPQNAGDWPRELRSFRENLSAGVEAARAQQANKPYDQAAYQRTMDDLERFDAMTQMQPALPIPPARPGADRQGWQRVGEALMAMARGEFPAPAVESYARMGGAYRTQDLAGFNAAVREYRGQLAAQFEPELRKGAQESLFNAYAPFIKAMYLYVLGGLLAMAYWFAPGALEWVRRSAAWTVGLALLVHSSGLIFRMVLEGRPPVTNLYSSAIFIGWGACVLGLVLERFWRNSIGLAVSSIIGFLTLIIAHHLSLSGDTMEMMRAVLDTNFWLATHVVVVTLGYASTFVAGIIALLYIVLSFFPRVLTAEFGRAMAKMVYGIICFATLFSFVGTVLGGIWADQSWGRFWGWDPKENGALIIVLWNAIILHAKWGGMVRERGLMNLALGGNIVTAWSWFGVNMLGIGLHSYGFTSAAFVWLVAFVSSQLLLIAVSALTPRLVRR